MEWIEADKFIHTDYESVLMTVPNYEGAKVIIRLGMWDPENDQWTTFGANWHPQPTHVMALPALPEVSADVIADVAKLSIYSAAKDRETVAGAK